MAKHSFWNPETLGMDVTREDFTELVTPIQYSEEEGSYYTSHVIRQTSGYIHDRTGIVTTDPVAFEKWLESIER